MPPASMSSYVAGAQRSVRTGAVTALTLSLTAGRALAQAQYTLPTTTATGYLQQATAKMQELASFTSSPLGALVVLMGFIGAAAGWVFAPKSGAVGLGMRAAAAGVVVFNITSLISYMVFSSSSGS
jgi:hypothetical protein